MASGHEHEKSTRLWFLPFSLLITICMGLKGGVISGVAFFIGGLWLSPDLDIESKCLKRWGVLKFLWIPYQKFIPHRSLLSHGPIIGTCIRILYLLILSMLIESILQIMNLDTRFVTIKNLNFILEKYPKEILYSFIGLEGSVWLHLIKDKDPLPFEWYKSIKKL